MSSKEKNLETLFQKLPSNYTNTLNFYINHDEKLLSNIDPQTTLLDYLRDNNYNGTKYGCGEGGCGACTVVIAEYDFEREQIKYRTANSCLVLLCSLHFKQVVTIEGIGDPENPHPVQERMAKGHGSQCGFCTPGIVMSLFGLLKINCSPSEMDIEEAFDGNLCRCTGYRPILDAARSFSVNTPPIVNGCNGHGNGSSTAQKKKLCDQLVDFTKFKPYDPNADISFPFKLTQNKVKPIFMFNNNKIWFQPTHLTELLSIKEAFTDAKLLSGNTEIGVEMKLKGMDYSVFVNVSHVVELKCFEIKQNERVIDIGANMTLTELIKNFEVVRKNLSTFERYLINAFLANLRWFASRQIRNFASLAGNISTASPISDLNPILIASNAIITAVSETDGQRQIPIRNFFLGYRKIDLKPNEIILKVSVPLPKSNLEVIRAYKQAKRKDDDIAIVNAAFRVQLEKINESYHIVELDLSYGGLAPTTIYLENVSKKCIGLVWADSDHLNVIEDAILNEVNFEYSVPGAMPTYRRTLAVSFFTRFWYQVIRDLHMSVNDDHLVHNIDEIERGVSKSSHDFGGPRSDDLYIGTVQSHLSALNQTTGAAKYTDDIPHINNELHGHLVMSTKSHAFIKNVDASKALLLDGVVSFVDYTDVPANNLVGCFKDEELFASKEVLFYGQVIGMILAESKAVAKKAADLVQVEYECLDSLITIEDAIEHNSFYDDKATLVKGQMNDSTFDTTGTNDLVFEGTCRVGGQDHFYLETHSCFVIPQNENNEILIYASTQNPTEVQLETAYVLGVPSNRVVCKVKRLGGGFGGKETRATIIALYTAVAAKKAKRPVRLVLERSVDMMITGGRNPFLANTN